MGIGLFDLGKVARVQGEADEARELIEEGLVLLRESDDLAQCAEALTDLAGIAQERGDSTAMVVMVREAVDILRRINSPYFLPDCLELLGGVLSRRGEWVAAARLFGAAEALREATAAGLDPSRRAAYAGHLAALRAGLSDSILSLSNTISAS